MDSGPENSDSFYIEGAPNNGPNPNDNFADDSDFGANYQQHSYRGGPRGQMGGMRGGGGGMRPPYGGGGNGPMNRPFGMQRCPPPGSYGPPRMPPGPRFQSGPSPRGMGGPRGPPPMMQGGYGDYQRPMRPPHFAPDANNGPDQMDGGWDMQGPPHHQNHQNGNPNYMGGGPQQQSGPPQNYGSGGPPQRNQHYGPPSGAASFQQPPHGMQQQQQQPVQQPGLDLPNVAPGDEIWVETKAGDGKSYYYHAKTRETTWTRPEGPNVKVLTQQQVEAMAQQSAARPSEATMIPPQQANNYGPNAQQQPPYYPTHPGWNMGAPTGPPAAAPVMVGPGPVPFPVMLGVDPGTDPALLSQAMEWCEYRSPEGKPYYFNVKSSSSVWEKPQILKDYEVARLSAAARAHAGAMPAVQVVSESVATAEMVLAKKSLDDQTPKAADQLDATKVEVKTEKEEVKLPKDKSRPVSSSPVTGTPWCVVWTGDGRVFFYNPSTRTSVWEKPDELKNRPDVDKLLSSTPGEKKDETLKDESRSGSDKKKRSDSYVEEPPVKKSKSDDDAGTIDEPVVVKEQPPVVKDTAMEAEVKAAQQRAIIPLEERVQQFKEMLAEKEVSAFSTWEKELHKIVFDSRYLLLTSKERKDVYEDFVRERVEEERREKRNRMKEKKDDFRNLMEDAKLSGKSTFSDFAHRYGKDERFRGVEKTRERESLFNEFIVEIRRKEKDDRDAQREKVRKEFENFLREQLGDQPSERYSRWTEVKRKLEDTKDSRLRNVDSSLREDYYRDWMRNVREKMEKKEKERESKNKDSKSSKKDKERDRSRDRSRDRKDKDRSKDKDRKSHKDKSKSGKSKDKSSKDKSEKRRRDKSTSQGGEPEEGEMRDEAEENGHKEDGSKEGEERQVYQIDDDDDIKAVTPSGETKNDEEDAEGAAEDDEAAEEEKEKRQRERKAREEASLREREKEVQRALAPHLRDRDKERIAHQHGEAVLHFTALLTDLIRNPDISWKEAKRTLRKDSRSEVTEILQKEEKEKMFAEHIEKLSFKKRMRFREMLDEIGELTLNTAWKKVRSLIKDDPRYDKFSSSDRKCEKEFIEYMKDKMVAAKADFRELLKENKFISYKSMKSIRESDQALKDIETTLSKDRRYLQLDCVRQERTDLLMAHLEELERKGPPPPPTASEPSRRDKH